MTINKTKNSGMFVKVYEDKFFIPLCKEYDVKRNAKEISEREKIPLQTLYYYIKKLGYNKPRRLYQLNEDYFNNINTSNKAYILDFIMADGCVCKSTKEKLLPDRLIINISYKDRKILDFIQKELNSNYKIKDYIPKNTYSNNLMSSLTINSTRLCSALIKLGIVPNKTGKESFPKIRQILQKHFIRGFLDGDGWITKNKQMLESIKMIINNDLNIKSAATIHEDYRNNKKNKNIYYLEYHHKSDIAQLKHYLYQNAKFYLKRKASKLP